MASAASSTSSGPVVNQIGRSNSSALIIFERSSLQPDHTGHVLVGGRFFFMCALPFLQIPNFKTAAVSHERHFAFEAKLAAHVFRQHEPALAIRCPVLGARVEMAQKNPAITRRNRAVTFSARAHPGKFLLRHDEKELVLRFGKNNELFAAL